MKTMKINALAVLELKFEHKKTFEESKLRLFVNNTEHANQLVAYHKKTKKLRLVSASLTLTYYEE